MTQTLPNLVESQKELEQIIGQAMQRVKGHSQKELCHYIPVETGGHMHHFTMKKLRLKSPGELAQLLKKYIIQTNAPQMVAPKPRAPRGSRKRGDQPALSRTQREKLLELARKTGDQELVLALAPKRSLAQCKKALMSSIRQNRAEPELWEAYLDQVKALTDSQFQP